MDLFRVLALPNRAGSHSLVAMEWIEVNIGKDWLSVADICEYMDVSTFVVTSVLRGGRLPAVKFGREWRVARQDFETWINKERGRSASFEPPLAPGIPAASPDSEGGRRRSVKP